MMYQVEWILENRIVLTRLVGDQTTESITQNVVALQAMFDRGDAPVHVVSDTRYLGKYPADLSVLRKLMSPHPNSGYTVILGGDRLSNFFAKLLTQFTGGRSPEFKNTVAEALQWLKAVDQSLPAEISFHEEPPA